MGETHRCHCSCVETQDPAALGTAIVGRSCANAPAGARVWAPAGGIVVAAELERRGHLVVDRIEDALRERLRRLDVAVPRRAASVSHACGEGHDLRDRWTRPF